MEDIYDILEDLQSILPFETPIYEELGPKLEDFLHRTHEEKAVLQQELTDWYSPLKEAVNDNCISM